MQQVIVNTSDPRVRRAYAQRLQENQEQLKGMFNRNKIERIEIHTDTDYLPALRTYFRSRKRR